MSDLIQPHAPRVTSETSPDSLPLRGYSIEQLAKYIQRQLSGGEMWELEISKQVIVDACNDALVTCSIWKPMVKPRALRLTKGVFSYLEGEDVGMGVVKVNFVEPNPVPTEIFYGNLIDPAPLFRTGLDDYDTFLRWRKTWKRVTSIEPDWYYDESECALYIHNPIERFQCAVFTHHTWSFEKMPVIHANWVKRYAVQKARLAYGEALAKYSGAIPGPMQSLQLDQGKRDSAQTEIDKLETELKGMQDFATWGID